MVTPSGGTGAYTYLWSDGQTTQQATNLAGGTYSVTITDSTGCSTSGFFTISGAGVELSVANQRELICHGASDGAVDLEPNIPATTGTLSYNWSNGATTEDISGLPAGLYTVTATADVNGITCTSTQSIEIREPPQPLLPIITQTAFADCINSDGNQFNATTTGGWPSHSYLWNDGETDPYRAYITGGTYTVTVTDGQGCKEEASITILPKPSLSLGKHNISAICKIFSGSSECFKRIMSFLILWKLQSIIFSISISDVPQITKIILSNTIYCHWKIQCLMNHFSLVKKA